jgi:hypothetical protein
MAVNSEGMSSNTDFDLHGIVGMRLVNASAKDIATVIRQVGPIQAALNREPDITIRFVDELPVSSPIKYLEVDEAGYTNDAFLILRSKHKSRARVQIPFEQIGKQCEIVCEKGLAAVPMLIAIINMTALTKGALPLHASAFTYNGVGVLATGWAKGGKTETLLGFIANGAEYVGDEWIYLSADGKHMYGIPEPIRIWDWHLNEIPQLWNFVSRGNRFRLKALRMVVDFMERITSRKPRHKSKFHGLMNRLKPLIKKQLYVHLPPKEAFNQEGTESSLMGTPEKIFFVFSHDAPDITVQPIDPDEVAQRMVFSLQYEQIDFINNYLKFRFAFPELVNSFIENSEKLQRDTLKKVLAGKEAYVVYHPYPVSIPDLYDAIKPLI